MRWSIGCNVLARLFDRTDRCSGEVLDGENSRRLLWLGSGQRSPRTDGRKTVIDGNPNVEAIRVSSARGEAPQVTRPLRLSAQFLPQLLRDASKVVSFRARENFSCSTP